MSLLKYLGKYKNIIFIIIFLIFTQAMMELLLPNVLSNIIDNGIVNNDMKYIFLQASIMLGIILVVVVTSLVSLFLASRVAVRFGQDIRKKVFEKVQGFSLKEFNKFGVASLITRTTNDINQVQTLTLMMLRMMILGPLMAVGGIIMAMYRDFSLSKILMISIPILFLAILVIGSKTVKMFSSIQKKLDKVNLISRENLTGIRVIRSFNKQKYEEDRFDEANSNLTNSTMNAYKIFAGLIPIMTLIFNLNSVAVIWFGSHRVNDGNLMVGNLIAFIQYSNQIMVALMIFFMLFAMLPKAISSAKRINEVLVTDFSIVDSDSEYSINKDKEITLEFKDVNFSYNGNLEECALTNLNFDCKAGETIAIIGSTGSGKTSILNLIQRLYDVGKGEILINGINIRNIPQSELRKLIGYVPQKAVLFSGDIRSNLLYGKENSTDEEMWEAIEIAQAYDFVSNLDNKLDANVAQGGSNFSGGQKQRLSIARALIRKPKIYLFDDSFSALDFKTDFKLRTALKKKVKDSIVIVVAQRVTSVMNSDKIIVLDNGKIVGIGTHDYLLKNCEVYNEIARSQLSEEELA